MSKNLTGKPTVDRPGKLTYWWPAQRPRELWIRRHGHPEWEAVQVPLRA
jgi:hypothetical protein